MPTYVYRNGQMVEKDTGLPMLVDAERAGPPPLPMLTRFEPYACPITGAEIRDERQHQANLKKHNCVEAADLPSPTNGEIRNARFAKKHGLEVSERYKDEPWRPKSNDRHSD